LKIQLSELLIKLRRLDKELVEEAPKVSGSLVKKAFFNLRMYKSTISILRNAINLKKVFGDKLWSNGLGAVIDLLRGKKIDKILSERTCFKHVLTLITIPYEDKGGLEDARLKDCPAVFAYEDVKTGRIRTTAFCSWQTIKDDVCREIQAHYEQKTERISAPKRERRSYHRQLTVRLFRKRT